MAGGTGGMADSADAAIGAAMDSGQSGSYGDEAETLITAAYTDGDVTIEAKGTDQDELQVAISFAF